MKKILSKGSNGYRVKSAYAKDFKFSKSFLENISVIDNIANTVLDLNDEIKINFYIKAIDLSADFSNISVSSVNDKSITYDHTIPSSLYITPKDFDTSAQIKFIAKFQNGNKIEQKRLAASGLGIDFCEIRSITPSKVNIHFILIRKKNITSDLT